MKSTGHLIRLAFSTRSGALVNRSRNVRAEITHHQAGISMSWRGFPAETNASAARVSASVSPASEKLRAEGGLLRRLPPACAERRIRLASLDGARRVHWPI